MTPSINRTTAVQVLIAFVCIAGLGMTAATLDSAEPVGASGDDQVMEPPNPRDAVDVGNDSAARGDGSGEGGGSVGNSYQSLTTCVEFLDTTVGTMLVLGSVLAISLLIYFRHNVALALFAGWTILPPTMLGYFLLTDCGVSGGISIGRAESGSFSMSGDGVVAATDVPPWLLIALVGTVFVAAAVLLYRSAGADETVIAEEVADEDEAELDRFAQAAGRAADRIEKHNDGVDNSVYRAWVEMTGLLDVEKPETYSAGEFATAAVELGMNEDDVTDLTQLFNEVRYGGRDVDTREDQAVSTLRNIESQYSGAVDLDAADDHVTDDTDTTESIDHDRTGANEEDER